MFSSSELSIRTIGCESQYIFEKIEMAIYKKREADIFLAKGLLQNYAENLKKLKHEIDSNPIYNHSYFDQEFKILFNIIYNIINILNNIHENELQATAFYHQISSKDYLIRKTIDETEKLNHHLIR